MPARLDHQWSLNDIRSVRNQASAISVFSASPLFREEFRMLMDGRDA